MTTPIFSPYLQISWAAARLSCACSHSGELVSITSAEENSLVTDIAGNTTLEKIWIGITTPVFLMSMKFCQEVMMLLWRELSIGQMEFPGDTQTGNPTLQIMEERMEIR